MRTFARFASDECGATAVEYGIIAMAMGVVLITAIPILGAAVTKSFSSIASHISSGQ